MLPLSMQNKLLAHKIAGDDFELDAPVDVGHDIVMLRKSLDIAAQAFFGCEAGNDLSPASLQAKLASFLHTAQSQRDENPNRQDGIYGANLTVNIKAAKGFSNSIFVLLTFGIECGNDNLLFLYTNEDGQWHQRLHWYSDKYTKPSDAFGDIYFFNSVPGSIESLPLLAVAHGHPWCTSVHSGFSLDLIRPATASSSQEVLDHVTNGYIRDGDPRMSRTADGLQLRVYVESEDASIVYHPGVLSYRTNSGKLILLPVALNARDFVDEWLQEPWSTVEHWSELTNLPDLHETHNRFDYSLHTEGAGLPGVTFGPVRGCTASADQLQIELDLEDSKTAPIPPVYAQVRQNPNSFTMLAITDKPDTACTRADLMHKPKR